MMQMLKRLKNLKENLRKLVRKIQTLKNNQKESVMIYNKKWMN